jgi:ribonuclease P protein component
VSFIPGDHGNGLTRPHVAYAIDKRCGNAVHRNLLRRRLRAIVADVARDLHPGAYLVRTEPAAQELSFQDLASIVAPTVVAAGTKGSQL